MLQGPTQYIIAGLAAALCLALCLSLVWGVRVNSLRAQHKAAHEETIRRYTDTQAKAQEKFDAQIAAIQAHNRRLNDEIDRKANDVAIVYRDRVISLPAAPAQCSAGSADLPAAGASQGGNGPGSDTVLLTRADALICAVNTNRLERVKEWADSINLTD